MSAASWAPIREPLTTSSNATDSPTFLRRMVITMAGTNPRCTSGYPNSPSSWARTRSTGRRQPATACQSPTLHDGHDGLGALPDPARRAPRGGRRRPWRLRSPCSWVAATSSRSRPAQKSRPPPIRATTRTWGSATASSRPPSRAFTRAWFNALRFGVRFRVSRRMPSPRSLQQEPFAHVTPPAEASRDTSPPPDPGGHLLGHLQLHAQHRRAEHLPLGVGHQGHGPASVQCPVQEEVQGMEVG